MNETLLVKRRTTAYKCEPPTAPDGDDVYKYDINDSAVLMPGVYPIATMDTDPFGNVWYVEVHNPRGFIDYYAIHADQLNDGGPDA